MEEEILDQQTEETAEAAPTEGEPESAEAPEEAPAEEPAPPEGDAEEEGKDDLLEAIAPKKKQTAQERFDELTWKRREAERQAEYWRKKAEEAERKAPEATAAAAPKGLPKEEDFDNYGEFVKAVVAYEFNKRQENTAAERARESEIQAVIAFNRKADRLREKFEDYDEVVQRPVFSTAMQKILWQSDNGPQLAYYLGRPENEKITLRIGNLDEAMAAYEIGRLEQKLIGAAKARKTTSAPPPVKPIAPLSKPAEGEIKDDNEWHKLERQRELEKLKKKLGG